MTKNLTIHCCNLDNNNNREFWKIKEPFHKRAIHRWLIVAIQAPKTTPFHQRPLYPKKPHPSNHHPITQNNHITKQPPRFISKITNPTLPNWYWTVFLDWRRNATRRNLSTTIVTTKSSIRSLSWMINISWFLATWLVSRKSRSTWSENSQKSVYLFTEISPKV